jgi:hypothetical protein
MVFTTILRSAITRLLAAFIIVLVVSPYSEPFATIDGTDFGGAGAVDVGGASKFKNSTDDGLVPPPPLVLVEAVFAPADVPVASAVTHDPRHGRRAVLRL